MSTLRRLPLLLALMATSCAGLGPNPNIQPQSVTGPCRVKPFFIVALNTSTTNLTIANTGEPCIISMFNPDLQVVQDGALVTTAPAHGRVVTTLAYGDRIVYVVYKAAPGYAGADRFNITFEPVARDVTFEVAVRPPGAAIE